jgi:hypothetical protein
VPPSSSSSLVGGAGAGLLGSAGRNGGRGEGGMEHRTTKDVVSMVLSPIILSKRPKPKGSKLLHLL